MNKSHKLCKDIMTTETRCLPPSDTAQAAAEIMKNEDIGSVVVCEVATGKLLGIVTDRDIAVKVTALGLSPATALESFVTWSPIHCYEDDRVEMAIQLMTAHQIRRLPIIERGGRLVGIISQGDIAVRLPEVGLTESLVKKMSQSPSPQYRQEHNS